MFTGKYRTLLSNGECVHPITERQFLTQTIHSHCYLEGDFHVGAHAAFKLAMTSIFNHKQIRAAEILENQSKESKVHSVSSHSSENRATGDKVEDAASSSAIPVAEANESTNATNTESTEALREKIEAAKDAQADLDDLNNDVKFVPDLEG